MSRVDSMEGNPRTKISPRELLQDLKLLKFRVRRLLIQLIALPLIKIQDHILLSDSSSYSRPGIPVSQINADNENPFFVAWTSAFRYNLVA